jgi:hypothetical protein
MVMRHIIVSDGLSGGPVNPRFSRRHRAAAGGVPSEYDEYDEEQLP